MSTGLSEQLRPKLLLRKLIGAAPIDEDDAGSLGLADEFGRVMLTPSLPIHTEIAGERLLTP